MTGYKTRHFYNNLLSLENVRYLEIGCWKGSSACSALCGNKINITCIDNWSEFGGPKQEFIQNVQKFIGQNTLNYIENDCFKVDRSSLGKFDIYLYDGNHTAYSQYRALNYFIDNMKDTFIFIVDDWNFLEVQTGTRNIISDLGLNVLYEQEILLTQNGEHTPFDKAIPGWWNGIYVAVLSKSSLSQFPS